MPVGVVGTQGHEGQPGTGGDNEVPVRVVAAVVRHLEHVRPQVDAAAAEASLGLGAEVAGEQDRQTARLGADDHRQVVGLRCGRGAPRIRREHLHGHGADRAPLTRHHGEPLAPGPVDEGREGGHPVVRR